jgi:hypothetical protein
MPCYLFHFPITCGNMNQLEIWHDSVNGGWVIRKGCTYRGLKRIAQQTKRNNHALNGIRIHDPRFQEAKTHDFHRTTTGITLLCHTVLKDHDAAKPHKFWAARYELKLLSRYSASSPMYSSRLVQRCKQTWESSSNTLSETKHNQTKHKYEGNIH